MEKILSSHRVGHMLVNYQVRPDCGQVGWVMIPAEMETQVVQPRTGLAGLPFIDLLPGDWNPPGREMDPLVQIKILGDAYPGPFSQGVTMRESPSVARFRLDRQAVDKDGERTTVRTALKDDSGLALEHRLSWHDGDDAVRVQTSFHNGSKHSVTLEMLSSFTLGGLTPFHDADAPGRLWVHRFRSVWSAEGRLETRRLEDLHLERSWSGSGQHSERFGQIGSLPVRGWFPFLALEDRGAGVVWAAQLGWAGSWQMEVFRKHDAVSLSGGLADREFGHWMKRIEPGETFCTPPAFLVSVRGDLDDACDALTALQNRAADSHPDAEKDLPVVFNEWCTTWGDPSHQKAVQIADRVRDVGVRYLVIDAGWFKEEGNWYSGQGDWKPNPALFPDGLEATAAAIRDRGLIPGLWFEMEVSGQDSSAFSLTDHLLSRDGGPLTVAGRRFWDLNDPWVGDYLAEKVIGLLRRCGFGYLKVDYNDTIGLGSDHPDSIGEGLRRQTEGTYRLFERIRRELPDLVIENCASGGHRLEPSMLARSAMSSFSDAHELPEIPIIAASLHRLLLPRQSQIWAVLHPSDTAQRISYSLAATFLGRMCLSGDVVGLSDPQWLLVRQAISLYRDATSVIRDGVSRVFGDIGPSWRYPEGCQALRRVDLAGNRVLIVAHAFHSAPETIQVPLPEGEWEIQRDFGEMDWKVSSSALEGGVRGDFTGSVVLLSRKPDRLR